MLFLSGRRFKMRHENAFLTFRNELLIEIIRSKENYSQRFLPPVEDRLKPLTIGRSKVSGYCLPCNITMSSSLKTAALTKNSVLLVRLFFF